MDFFSNLDFNALTSQVRKKPFLQKVFNMPQMNQRK